MAVAFFDLDHTLLNGDSDHAWGDFMAEHGLVDQAEFKRINDQFYIDYQAGNLDILAYLEFALSPLKQTPMTTLLALREQFIAERIQPMIVDLAQALVNQHRQAGRELVIVTATNRFVTAPIAEIFNIEHLIATDLEMQAGQYTGQIDGVACFQTGKVTKVKQWLIEHHCDLKQSFFYSDSHNDIPLLELVDNPIAVDPDEKLSRHCQRHGWATLKLHVGN